MKEECISWSSPNIPRARPEEGRRPGRSAGTKAVESKIAGSEGPMVAPVRGFRGCQTPTGEWRGRGPMGE